MAEYRQVRFERPAGATELLLIRHGESRAASADHPFPMTDGRGDPELHPNGQRQAEALGVHLMTHPIEALYVTSLRRTHETAAPLARALNITPVVEPALREVSLGEWEGGLFRVKAHERDPVYMRMQAERRWDVIPGAESYTDLNARVLPALESIVRTHMNQLVALVLHGGIIGHILERATGAAPMSFAGADNGSISRLVWTPERWILRSFNDTAHLPQIQGADGGLS